MAKQKKIKEAIKLLESLKKQDANVNFIGLKYEFDELDGVKSLDGTFTITITGELKDIIKKQ